MPAPTPPRQKLTDAQKAEVRTQMAAYKRAHPDAALKEVRAHLNVPYQDQVTEAVLRGLAPRGARPPTSPANGPRRRPARRGPAASTRAVGTPRQGGVRRLDQLVRRLSTLRTQRQALDEQIGQLESDLQERIERELGSEQARRIFAGG